ncbi:MAG: alpha/beta hydrolase [Planctomycetota bacterium]|nr:alpha/beta hydrolase [Planctomycetota bacterium]MDA1140879.1 alpha/beta hydrolase [Planctomycetota bacterium]
MTRHKVLSLLLVLNSCLLAENASQTVYKTESNITYCEVDGVKLIMNAFLPQGIDEPAPAMVHIHGGWWTGGGPMNGFGGGQFAPFTSRKIAVFSIQYRLGKQGGFPENIRDCRNAVRFVRKNAERFNIDPERIGCFGGSAGGHLSMMVAMAPEDFKDGGPTTGLEGISPGVSNGFAWVGPTDFVRQWNESVPNTPNNAHPYHRVLFKERIPDTEENKAHYLYMSPMGHVRKEIPPLLVCDGEKDPIVPNQPGLTLTDALKKAGADASYWLTKNGGHGFPGGEGFSELLGKFLSRTLKIKK